MLKVTSSQRSTLAAISLLVALIAICFALPAQADAKKKAKKVTPIVGVGDNNWPMFHDNNYKALGTKISRLVIPYDFYRNPVELERTRLWLEGARASGVDPLVSLHRSEKYPTKLPTVAEFSESVKFLLSNFPWLKTISPWNEANHKSQPTVKNPKRAAQYFNQTKILCPSCKIVAADVLDQTNLQPWLKKFLRYAKKPKIWGLHSYTDANRNKPWKKSATLKFLRATKGEVWLTEVGGIVAFNRTYAFNPDRAAVALKRTLDMGFRDKRIKRIYLYCWFGSMSDASSGYPYDWDSGLVDPDGKTRTGYNTLKSWLDKNPKARASVKSRKKSHSRKRR